MLCSNLGHFHWHEPGATWVPDPIRNACELQQTLPHACVQGHTSQLQSVSLITSIAATRHLLCAGFSGHVS